MREIGPAMSESGAILQRGTILGPVPIYFGVFASWWALGMFALAIRVPVTAWAPVVELFWWEALLTEKLFGQASRWIAGLIWLIVYTLAAISSCVLWERKRGALVVSGFVHSLRRFSFISRFCFWPSGSQLNDKAEPHFHLVGARDDIPFCRRDRRRCSRDSFSRTGRGPRAGYVPLRPPRRARGPVAGGGRASGLVGVREGSWGQSCIRVF